MLRQSETPSFNANSDAYKLIGQTTIRSEELAYSDVLRYGEARKQPTLEPNSTLEKNIKQVNKSISGPYNHSHFQEPRNRWKANIFYARSKPVNKRLVCSRVNVSKVIPRAPVKNIWDFKK